MPVFVKSLRLIPANRSDRSSASLEADDISKARTLSDWACSILELISKFGTIAMPSSSYVRVSVIWSVNAFVESRACMRLVASIPICRR